MLIPTPRLLLLALGGVPLIAISGTYATALFVAVVWTLALAVVVAVDSVSAPSPQKLVWRRDHESKLSLGAWNLITLTVENQTRRLVHLKVRDAVPPELQSEGEGAEGLCLGHDEWSTTYRALPLRRGDYHFGPISARVRAPLGLVWRQWNVPLQDPFKVYPNLLAVRSYEIVLRRGQLDTIGLRSSRRWGEGTEFERLRDYTPDDEFRRISWTATARRHTPIAIDYQTERSQTIMLVLDAGRLMSTRLPLVPPAGGGPDAGAGLTSRQNGTERGTSHALSGGYELSRLDYAVNAALLLGFAAQRNGDRIGLLGFDDRVNRFLTPRPGRHQFLALTEALYNLEATATEPDYGAALAYLASRHRRRSLIVLFTDVTEPEAASVLIAHLGRLARHHLAMVVTLRDPEIERLAALPTVNSESVYRRAVGRVVLDGREQVLTELRRRGVLTVDVAADQISAAVINRYLEVKARSAL